MRNSKPSQPIPGPGCLFHFCRAVFSITFEHSGLCVDMCNLCTSVCASGESKYARTEWFYCGGWHKACRSLVTFGCYDIDLDALKIIWSIPYALLHDSIRSNQDSMPRTGNNHRLSPYHFFLNVFAIMVIKNCFVIFFEYVQYTKCNYFTQYYFSEAY